MGGGALKTICFFPPPLEKKTDKSCLLEISRQIKRELSGPHRPQRLISGHVSEGEFHILMSAGLFLSSLRVLASPSFPARPRVSSPRRVPFPPTAFRHAIYDGDKVEISSEPGFQWRRHRLLQAQIKSTL